jgi:hypothetical protein
MNAVAWWISMVVLVGFGVFVMRRAFRSRLNAGEDTSARFEPHQRRPGEGADPHSDDPGAPGT